ncbi:MAG: UPF0175 family protein [Planctomycetaceae bacterium]
MPLTISDDRLSSAGVTEAEARVAIACRHFEPDKLSLWAAAQWIDVSRMQFAHKRTRQRQRHQ